jgi:hypothetical protein
MHVHLLQCIIAGLVITGIGLLFLARYSKSKDPDEERKNAKVRDLYNDDPEFRIGEEENMPDWKKTHSN